MTTQSRSVALVVALAVLAGAITLYVLSRNVHDELYSDIRSKLQELQALDSQWSLEVIRVSTNSKSDFDSLAAMSPSVRQHKNALVELLTQPAGIDSDAKNALRAYLSLLDGKEERIERFKSGFAIVRNSQRFLPAAAAEAAASARANDAPGVAVQVDGLLAALEPYLAAPSEVERQRIELALENMRRVAGEAAPNVSSLLGTFLAHAKVLLEQKEPMDKLLAAATDQRTVDAAERLKTLFSQLHQRALSFKQGYSLGIIALLALLFLLTLAILSLGRSRRSAASQDAADQPATASAPQGAMAASSGAAVGTGSARMSLSAGLESIEAMAARMEHIHVTMIAEDIAKCAAGLRSQVRLLRELQLELSQGLTDTGTALDATLRGSGTADSHFESALAGVRERLTDVQELDTIAKLAPSMQRDSQRLQYAATVFARGTRSGEPRIEDWVDVNECMDAAIEITALADAAQIHTDYGDLPPIRGVRLELVTLFVNIFNNSIDALRERPTVRIRSEIQGTSISVTIIDNGTGMESATRTSAFGMYFTTKEGARGIGLSTVAQLAARHHGQVLLNSTTGTGTAVRILLPVDANSNGLPAG